MQANDAADQIQARLKKLKRLADKGIAGEALAAQHLLEKVAKKHNIDISSISSEVRKFSVKATSWRLQLLFQLCAVVCGADGFKVEKGTSKNEYAFECAENDWLEVIAKFKVLEKDYKEQQALFYEAFIVCNDLALKSSQESQQDADKDVSKMKKVQKLAKGLTKSQMRSGRLLIEQKLS